MNRFIGLVLVSSLFAPLGCAAEQTTESESADYGLSSESEQRASVTGEPAPTGGSSTNSTVSWLEYTTPQTGQEKKGPLPEPWAAGPLPEPWNSSSSSSTSSTSSTTSNGSTTTSSTTTSSTTSSGGNGDKKR